MATFFIDYFGIAPKVICILRGFLQIKLCRMCWRGRQHQQHNSKFDIVFPCYFWHRQKFKNKQFVFLPLLASPPKA